MRGNKLQLMKQRNLNLLNLSISSFKNALIFLISGELALSLLFLTAENNTFQESQIDRNSISKKNNNLIVLGDSFTKGGYLNINERLTTHLEKSNLDFNLVNMAHGGLVGSDYCDTMESLIQDNIIDTDDIILIFWNFNDILPPRNNSNPQAEHEKNDYTLFSGYKKFLSKNINNYFYNKGIILPFSNTYSLAYESYCNSPFDRLNRIQNKTPAKIVFVPLPKFNLLSNPGVYTQFQNSLNELNENIILIDVLDLFVGSPNDKFAFNGNDHHPNPEAIFMVFKTIQTKLDSMKSNAGLNSSSIRTSPSHN